jgi:hypothetical protein
MKRETEDNILFGIVAAILGSIAAAMVVGVVMLVVESLR